MGSNGQEIRQLEDASVRRIVAEQAVTDLASVVKELVDNALDAQSTSINSKYTIRRLEAPTSIFILIGSNTLPFFLSFFIKFDYSIKEWKSLKYLTMDVESLLPLDPCSPRDMRLQKFATLKIFTEELVSPWDFGGKLFLVWRASAKV